VVYLPPLQHLFDTAPLGLPELAVLAVFPIIVWGSDELRRWWRRRGVVNPAAVARIPTG
jgi:hypothetical protein